MQLATKEYSCARYKFKPVAMMDNGDLGLTKHRNYRHMDRMDQIGPAPQSNAGILTSHSCDANIYIFAPSSNSDVASCFCNAIKNL